MSATRSFRARAGVLAASVLAGVFLLGSFLVPILESAGHGWGVLMRLAYSPVCHQLAQRSIQIDHSTQAVCARCSGLYFGGVAGLLAGAWFVAGRSRRLRPSWLVWAVAPTAFDALLPWIGLPGLPNLPRLVLALPAGFVAGVFLASGLGDLLTPARSGRDPYCGTDTRPLEEAHG